MIEIRIGKDVLRIAQPEGNDNPGRVYELAVEMLRERHRAVMAARREELRRRESEALRGREPGEVVRVTPQAVRGAGKARS